MGEQLRHPAPQQPAPPSGGELTGLSGLVADVIAALGEVGVAMLTLLETVFPPIPSEVVLPLAGFLAQQDRLNLLGVLTGATAGSLLGALLLYGAGVRLGQDRATELLARLPLIEPADVRRASGWFTRHGRSAVFFGRLIPGVRSLISLPAGAQRMPLPQFICYTVAGSGLWNALLIGTGYALGTQWERVEGYAEIIDIVFLTVLVMILAVMVFRGLRRRRARKASRR